MNILTCKLGFKILILVSERNVRNMESPYTVGSCWCQHCIFNVAECNLGKAKLETMLASCLSLEFTGVAMGLSQGHLGFYGYLIEVISFRLCYVL